MRVRQRTRFRQLTGAVMFFLLTLSLLLGSCARIPEPVGYPYTQQQKMQAAHHWEVLAADVANRVNNELIINDYIETPVYVKTTCGDEDNPCGPNQASSFNEAFRDLLITELVGLGVPVRQYQHEDAITLHYKVQLVHHKAKRLRTYKPGVLTSLTAGIMVFRNAPHELMTIASIGMLDFLNSTGVRDSSHEVIITTSMVAKDNYLFRTSDIYYINSRDFLQYQEQVAQSAELKLVSPDRQRMSRSQPEATATPLEPLPIPIPEDPAGSEDI